MPTYSYKCDECGPFDWIHPMQDTLTECPKCGSQGFGRMYNPVGISFKGSGFYSTDSKGK